MSSEVETSQALHSGASVDSQRRVSDLSTVLAVTLGFPIEGAHLFFGQNAHDAIQVFSRGFSRIASYLRPAERGSTTGVPP